MPVFSTRLRDPSRSTPCRARPRHIPSRSQAGDSLCATKGTGSSSNGDSDSSQDRRTAGGVGPVRPVAVALAALALAACSQARIQDAPWARPYGAGLYTGPWGPPPQPATPQLAVSPPPAPEPPSPRPHRDAAPRARQLAREALPPAPLPPPPPTVISAPATAPKAVRDPRSLAAGAPADARQASSATPGNLAGTWAIQTAGAKTCHLTLSSMPTLDLYRASTASCANEDLKSINAWGVRGNEVVLYKRGAVVARAAPSGAAYYGRIEKSGIPLNLTR